MTIATHRLPHDGNGYSEALDYDRLPEPWREWAKIARTFAYFAHLDRQDREDLLHNIIVRCAEVAEVYRQRGIPFNRGAVIKTAQYTRLRFYHQKKRWKRVFSVSLNSMVSDFDGEETEMIQTILDEKGIDLDAWLDFKTYYQSRPRKERKAIRKLVRENWRNLSGYDWKLIKTFRKEAKEMVLA
jgi:DNA-directed RNA polymerase specialized sigma24 family protein